MSDLDHPRDDEHRAALEWHRAVVRTLIRSILTWPHVIGAVITTSTWVLAIVGIFFVSTGIRYWVAVVVLGGLLGTIIGHAIVWVMTGKEYKAQSEHERVNEGIALVKQMGSDRPLTRKGWWINWSMDLPLRLFATYTVSQWTPAAAAVAAVVFLGWPFASAVLQERATRPLRAAVMLFVEPRNGDLPTPEI